MKNLSRHDWLKLNWNQAQRAVVELFHENGYTSYHELSLTNGRADGFVIKKKPDEIIFGIIEVKHYNNVTKNLQYKSVKQALKYLNAVHDKVSSKYTKIPVRFFIAVIFSKDYPSSGISVNLEAYKTHVPKPIAEKKNLTIIVSSAGKLLRVLKHLHLLEAPQTELNHYFFQ